MRWLLAVLLVATVGCAGAPAPGLTDKGVSTAAQAPKPAAAAPAAAATSAPAAARSAAAPAAAGQAAPASTGNEASTVVAAADKPWDRMIIRNATLGLRVENVERALTAARQVAGNHGGFVSASNTRLDKVGDREQMIATATLQVRADAFDVAVSELRGLAVKVDSEVGTSQDVTEEYVDLGANLRNLQRTEMSLVALMEKATKLEDVLTLQRELTNVRSQIERIQGRKTFLERRSDMSTITLTLQPAEAAAVTVLPPVTTAWDPSATFERGWAASLRVLRIAADAAILAVAFFWWLIPFAAIGLLVLLRRRPQPVPPTA